MKHSQWSLGLLAAEREYQESGYIAPLQGKNTEFCQGWNDYIAHNLGEQRCPTPAKVPARLNRIHNAYCRAVTKVNYAIHTELEVLGILQRLQDKRRRLTTKVYAYELARRNK